MDANRRTRRGRGTHEKAMRAVRVLQEQGLAFHVITVLTERTLDHRERLFDFYVQNAIKDVGSSVSAAVPIALTLLPTAATTWRKVRSRSVFRLSHRP
jgi:sulfatase maturation enzyme AslB (radical SAM superfamily)